MRAQQVYYTSCRRGRSSSSGFQVRTHSAGLSDRDMQEVVRLSNYRLPSSFLTDPSNIPPVAYRYHRLSSGRGMLLRACYVGNDYSGRGGNFFSHALIPVLQNFDSRPNQYFQWRNWVSGLSPAEDTEEVPPLLAEVEVTVDDVPFDGAVFVNGKPNGRAMLTAMVESLFFVRKTGRRIVIRDQACDGWKWISCVLETIPPQHATDITFSTYQFNGVDCADINATIANTYFNFSPNQRDYELFAFEPTTGLRSALPEIDPPVAAAARAYATQVVNWYLDDPSRLREFFASMGAFNLQAVDTSLVTGLEFFLARTQTQSPAIRDLATLISFGTEQARPERLPEVISWLTNLASRFDGQGSEQTLMALIRLAINAKARGNDAGLCDTAFQSWLSLFELALGNPARLATEAVRSWTSLTEAFGPEAGRRALFLDTQIDRLQSCATSPEGLGLLARLLVKATAGRPSDNRVLDRIVNAAAVGSSARIALPMVLEAFGDPADVLEMIDRLDAVNSDVLAFVIHKWCSGDLSSGWALRQRLYMAGRHALLEAEFHQGLATASLPESFSRYMDEGRRRLPEFIDAHEPLLTSAYWETLPDSARTDQAWAWLAGAQFPQMTPTVLRQVLDRGNAKLPLDPNDEASRAANRRLAGLAATSNVALRPDRPALRQLLHEAGSAPDADVDNLADRASRLSTDLKPIEYKTFVKLLAPDLIRRDAGRACIRLIQMQPHASTEKTVTKAILDTCQLVAAETRNDDVYVDLAFAAIFARLGSKNSAADTLFLCAADTIASMTERRLSRLMERVDLRIAALNEKRAKLQMARQEFAEAIYTRQTSPIGAIRSMAHRFVEKTFGWIGGNKDVR